MRGHNRMIRDIEVTQFVDMVFELILLRYNRNNRRGEIFDRTRYHC